MDGLLNPSFQRFNRRLPLKSRQKNKVASVKASEVSSRKASVTFIMSSLIQEMQRQVATRGNVIRVMQKLVMESRFAPSSARRSFCVTTLKSFLHDYMHLMEYLYCFKLHILIPLFKHHKHQQDEHDRDNQNPRGTQKLEILKGTQKI